MHKMCAEMEVIMGKEKSIGKREFYEIKFLKRLMMFGVVAAAAVTILCRLIMLRRQRRKRNRLRNMYL